MGQHTAATLVTGLLASWGSSDGGIKCLSVAGKQLCSTIDFMIKLYVEGEVEHVGSWAPQYYMSKIHMGPSPCCRWRTASSAARRLSWSIKSSAMNQSAMDCNRPASRSAAGRSNL